MTAEDVIVARKLAKHYGVVHAVDGIDLQVRRGEVFGFLGRNGAGKTTTIRLLLGLVRPTGGTIEMLGSPIAPGRQNVLARVGALVETATSYPNLTVRENLSLQQRLLRLPPSSVGDAIARLGLEEYTDRRAGTLSLGNKQRLAIARAMLHRPDLLILDEPVNGLDPAGIIEIRHLLRHLADEDRVTVFLSSHLLSEISQLADRICIIHEGRIVDDLDRAELHRRSRRALELVVSDARRAASLLASGLRIGDVEDAGGGILRVFEGTERPAALTRMLVEHGVDVSQIVLREENLEDYFMRLTGGAA